MALVKGTNCGFVTVAPSADPGGDSTTIDGQSLAFKDTTPANINTVTEIGWWCDNNTEAADYEVGIYTHNVGDDNPEAKVGNFSTGNAKGVDNGWKKVTGLSIPVVAETIYWIAHQLDDTSTGTVGNKNADAGEKRDTNFPETALTDPWGVSDATDGNLHGTYALVSLESESATDNMTIIGEGVY